MLLLAVVAVHVLLLDLRGNYIGVCPSHVDLARNPARLLPQRRSYVLAEVPSHREDDGGRWSGCEGPGAC